MLRGLQPVCLFKVREFEEETAHLRCKKQHPAEEKQEHRNALHVMHRVVRVELDAVQRHAIGALILLDLDSIRVVRAHLVECQNMQHNQCQQHDRQRHNVQRKEPVQRDSGQQIIAADPGHDVLANHGNSAEQRNDHLCAPVGHLPPRQHIAYEGLGHEHDKNHHAEDPDELTRLLVRAIHERPHHVQIDHDKKRRRAGGVHVAQQPSVIHIAHDVFD